MDKFLVLSLTLVLLSSSFVVCPPPNRQTAEQPGPAPAQPVEHKAQETQQHNADSDSIYKFPYSKYLELVVKILETEPKFQDRIKGMNEEEIKTGKIADHIDDLGNEVFDQLTKAKIAEIDRLREEIQKQIEKEGDAKNIKMPEHIDVNDWEKFGKEDLRKLITKTVADMNAIDEQRKEEFKKYEMEKKAQEDHRLAQLSEEERQKALNEIEESKKRHNEHEKLKHPGGREQLEEVWEERDHMDKQNFDPKSFFALHDLNGDGQWNEEELEALFQVELEKVYNETNPDDDPKERIEEMYRMREHVVQQMDKNGDRMISLEEFLQDNEAQGETKTDEGWDDLAKQKIYTDDELKRFEEDYAKQQGWGDHPYDRTTTHPPQNFESQQGSHGAAQQQQMPPVNNPNNQQPPQHQTQIPPVHAPIEPANSQQQHVNNELPKVPKPVDPVYGV